MAEESKTNEKNEKSEMMIIPNMSIDRSRQLSRLSSSPSSPTGLTKSSSVKMNCLCSPTTHVGSFRCRYHRNSGLTRNSMSVGAKLSDLAAKTAEVVAGKNEAS